MAIPDDGNGTDFRRRFTALSRRMTVDGDSPQSGIRPQHPPQDMVHPTIYRYTCRGRLSLSNQKRDLLRTTGHCRGLATQLELVDVWRTVPREEAIQVFAQQVAAQSGNPSGATAVAAADSSRSAGGTKTEQTLQTAVESPVLVYPAKSSSSSVDQPAQIGTGQDSDHNNTDGDDDDDDQRLKETSQDDSVKEQLQKYFDKEFPVLSDMTPEAPTVLFQSQDWNCYGSTEVDLLVLRDAKDTSEDDYPRSISEEDYLITRKILNQEESVAAVAPFTMNGWNIREVSHNNWSTSSLRDRTTTVRLGVLEIIYQQIIEDVVDDPSVNNRSIANGTSGDDTHRSPANASTAETIQSFAERYGKTADKIWHKMQDNASLLRDSVREDFPGRTYAAGQRIVDKFDSTWNSMQKFASKVVGEATRLWDDDDQDDPKKGGGSRGGW